MYQIKATVPEGKIISLTLYGDVLARKQAQAVKRYLEDNGYIVTASMTRDVDLALKK